MTEKEIMESLNSVRNALGDASTYASTSNEYASEAECAADRAASAANEAMDYADAAMEELSEVLNDIENKDVAFWDKREKIIEETRLAMRNEVVYEVVNELMKVMSNKVINVLLSKGQGPEGEEENA